MPAVTSTPDLRASQVVTSMVIASGATGTPARLIIFDVSGSSDTLGGIRSATFLTGSIGSDVFVFVSGSTAARGTTPGNTVGPGLVLFGGNIATSGSAFVDVSMFVSRTLAVTGSLVLLSSLNLGSQSELNVSGVATFGGDVFMRDGSKRVGVSGTLEVAKSLVMTSSTSLMATSGTLTVSGAAFFTDAVGLVGVSGTVSVAGDLYSTNANKKIAISGNLSSNGDAYFSNTARAVSVSGTFTAGGNSWFSSPSALHLISGTVQADRMYFPVETAVLGVSGTTFLRGLTSSGRSQFNGTDAALFDGGIVLAVTGIAVFGSASLPPTASLGSATSFFVSGAIGSIFSGTNRGTAVFGGDVFVSGALVANSGVIIGQPFMTSTGSWYVAGALTSNIGAGTTTSPAHDTLRAVPHSFETRVTLTQLSFRVTTGGLLGQVRLGIYNTSSSNDYTPTTLIVDSGILSATVNNTTMSSSINVTLNPGTYWFAYNQTGSAPVTIRGVQAAMMSNRLGLSDSLLSVNFITTSSVFTNLPSNFPTGFTLSSGDAPAIAFKRS